MDDFGKGSDYPRQLHFRRDAFSSLSRSFSARRPPTLTLPVCILRFARQHLKKSSHHETSIDVTDRLRQTLSGADLAAIVETKNMNEEYLDGRSYSPTLDDFDRWHSIGTTARRTIAAGAWLFALTGDREAGPRARDFLLRFCGFDNWMNLWLLAHHMYSYYPAGRWCQDLAVGYDLLYPLLTEENRALVRQALLQKSIIPHYQDHAVLNRLPSQVTNHIGMNSTGILLAAIALLGDESEDFHIEPYLSGILTKYKAHIDAACLPDGSYAEPLVRGSDAIERNLGIDWTTTTPVRLAYIESIYKTAKLGQNPVFGDGGLQAQRRCQKPTSVARQTLRRHPSMGQVFMATGTVLFTGRHL